MENFWRKKDKKFNKNVFTKFFIFLRQKLSILAFFLTLSFSFSLFLSLSLYLSLSLNLTIFCHILCMHVILLFG